MKTLIVNMWESDNVDFEVQISNKFAAKILSRFKAFCKAEEYDLEECLEDYDTWDAFFDENKLDDIDSAGAERVRKTVEAEVIRSIQEFWADPDDQEGLQEEIENCEWGFRPLILAH